MQKVGIRLARQVFTKQRILVELGAKLDKVEHGLVQISLPYNERITQQHGFMHGGVISTLADTAAGLSCFTDLTQEHHSCISVEFKINFLRPITSDVIAIGNLIKGSKSLMFANAEVLTTDQKLCAYMVQTIKRITQTNQ